MKSRQLLIASTIILVLMQVSCRQLPVFPVSLPKDSALSASSASHGCTSFCLQNGDYCIFGTNHDNSIPEGILYVNKRGMSKTGWEYSSTGEVARWTSKYGSLTFNLVGYQQPWSGMNEAGLVISTMSLEPSLAPAPDRRPPLETVLWIQYQLDNSSSVEEVIASESLVRMTSVLSACCHFLVCDRTGDCATVELLEGEMVYHRGETLPVAALTNNIYEDSVQAWNESSLEELAKLEESVFSLFRFALAANRVTGFKPTDSKSAVEVAFDTLAEASNDWTVWSIVYDAENLQVHFRTTSNSHIRTIDLNKLEFTCGTPVQMLDVHADLSGDISSDLETYDHAISLDHNVNVLRKLGLETSRDVLGSLLRQMEDFQCADGKEHIIQETPPVPPWTWLIPVGVLVVVLSVEGYRARKRGKQN